MKYFLTIMLIISCFFYSATTFSKDQAKDTEPEQSKYRLKIDDRIRRIEKAVEELNQGYKDKSIWDIPGMEAPPNETTSHKLKRYSLSIPTYLVRFVTWPVAAVGNALIKKGVVDKVVNLLSNDERTVWVYPRLELGFGTGFGGGVGFEHFDLFHKDYNLSAYYQIHVNLNQEFEVSLQKDDAFYYMDRPFDFDISTEFFRHHDTNFFGLGVESSEGNKSKYGLDEVRSGGWLDYELFDNLDVRFNSYFVWDNTRVGSGGTPTAGSVFPPTELPGYRRALSYASFGLSLIHDSRDCDAAPMSGGLRNLSYWRYQGLGTTEYDYNEFSLDVAQYIRIMMPRNVIALRTYWVYQFQNDGAIPFYRLPKLDVNAPLRSYDYGRFTDKGMAVFNVEYRFPVWQFIDGQLFFDTGRVFHTVDDFSFRHFKYSGGLGLRFRTEEFFLMRVQAAFGAEGAKFLLKTSQAF
jgi:hypothetical protein